MIGRELTNFHLSKVFLSIGEKNVNPIAVKACKMLIRQTKSPDHELRLYVLDKIRRNYQWISVPFDVALKKYDFNTKAAFYLQLNNFRAYQDLVDEHGLIDLRNFMELNPHFLVWFASHSKWGSFRFMSSVLTDSQLNSVDNISIANFAIRDTRRSSFIEAYSRLDDDAKKAFVFDSGYPVLAKLIQLEWWKEFKHLFNRYLGSVHQSMLFKPDNNGKVFLYYMAKKKCCSTKVADYVARFSTGVYENIPEDNKSVIQTCVLKRLAKYGVDISNTSQSL